MKRRPSPRKPDTTAATPDQPASIGDGQSGRPGKDLVLAALARALLITLIDPDASGSPLFLEQLLQALRIHLQEHYGDPAKPKRPRQAR